MNAPKVDELSSLTDFFLAARGEEEREEGASARGGWMRRKEWVNVKEWVKVCMYGVRRERRVYV